jgi:aldose 1-epimerase
MRHEPESVLLRLDVVPQTGWPFEVRVEIRYALHAEAGLVVSAEATNTGERRAPFGAGFHPYLATGGTALDDVTVALPSTQRLVLDDAHVPVGEQAVAGSPYDLRKGKKLKGLRLDDGFTGLTISDGRGVAEVRAKSGGARLWFDETFRYLQVFTLDDLAGAPAVALEPMTCAPDAFNSGHGLLILEPGANWTGAWGVTPLA